MNTTHVEHDAVAALRAELTMAAGRRIRRHRARRRTAVIIALIALLLAATAATAALTKFSTGVPAVDELLDVEDHPGGGPVSASRRLIVTEGDHRTNVVAYLTDKGSVCITTADFHRGGARGSFGGCPPLESVNRQLRRRGTLIFGMTIGLDRRTYNMLVAGSVRSAEPLGTGDWRVLMTPPWRPKAPAGRPLRLLVLIDDRDYGNPDDGFQMDDEDDIPRDAWSPPKMRLTFRDGHHRVARAP